MGALTHPTHGDVGIKPSTSAIPKRTEHMSAELSGAAFLVIALVGYLAGLRISWKAAALLGCILIACDLYELWRERHPHGV